MRRFDILATLCLALVAASPAFPAERGFYVSADAGVSRGEGQFTGGSAVNFVESERDDDATFLRVRVGYQFAKFIAVEVGYVDLGDFEYDIGPPNCPTAIPANCDFTTQLSARGPLANVVLMWPLTERFRVKGRFGFAPIRFEGRESGPNASANPASGKDTEGNGHWSAAAAFRATPKLDVELEYTRFTGADFAELRAPGAAHFEPGKISIISLGVQYRFF